MKGEGNQIDYGMRVYDPRLGKFLSVDPLAKSFPWNSTYAYAENDVIRCIDLDGLEKISIHQRTFAPWSLFGNILPGQKSYGGDNRGFALYYMENNKWNTSRIVSITQIDVKTAKQIGSTTVYSHPSIGPKNFYGPMGSSTETPDETTKVERMYGGGKVGYYGANVSINMQGHDARVEDYMAPDIDWTGKLFFDDRTPGILSLSAGGTGKGFPAYEQFIEDSRGSRIMTATYSAPPKSQIFRLFSYKGSTDVDGSYMKIDMDKNGNFAGTLSVLEQVEYKGPWWKALFKRAETTWNKYTIDEWNKKQTSKQAAADQP